MAERGPGLGPPRPHPPDARVVPPGEIVVYAAPDVVNSLESDYGELVDGVEDETGRSIDLRSDDEYSRENYDIVVEQADP